MGHHEEMMMEERVKALLEDVQALRSAVNSMRSMSVEVARQAIRITELQIALREAETTVAVMRDSLLSRLPEHALRPLDKDEVSLLDTLIDKAVEKRQAAVMHARITKAIKEAVEEGSQVVSVPLQTAAELNHQRELLRQALRIGGDDLNAFVPMTEENTALHYLPVVSTPNETGPSDPLTYSDLVAELPGPLRGPVEDAVQMGHAFMTALRDGKGSSDD